jgi:hypothetical protein
MSDGLTDSANHQGWIEAIAMCWRHRILNITDFNRRRICGAAAVSVVVTPLGLEICISQSWAERAYRRSS